jgi:hypothetical protein
MQFGEVKYAWDQKPFGHSMLPYISEPTSLYGTRWQTLDPKCQLENLIQPFLLGTATFEAPTRILVFGDSTGTNVG